MSNFEQLYSEYTKLEMLYERGDISRIQLNEAAINARKLNL